ncbi:MAG: hypothetical protein KIT27_03855 [Legionellales bacterium]|nr:hypothetical protein [Legionellales bacterium]
MKEQSRTVQLPRHLVQAIFTDIQTRANAYGYLTVANHHWQRVMPLAIPSLEKITRELWLNTLAPEEKTRAIYFARQHHETLSPNLISQLLALDLSYIFMVDVSMRGVLELYGFELATQEWCACSLVEE